MNHQCPECGATAFRVIKTYPCEDHTLRHLKCRICKTNVFTHEYIMLPKEYHWQTIEGKTKLRLRT
jgi:hypothetical protein